MNPTNENTIRALLRRFMDGETSLDDERLLAEYFRDHPVPEDLRPYHDMFVWFDRGMPPAATPRLRRLRVLRRVAVAACVAGLVGIGVWLLRPQTVRQAATGPTPVAPTAPVRPVAARAPERRAQIVASSGAIGQPHKRPRLSAVRPAVTPEDSLPPATIVSVPAHEAVAMTPTEPAPADSIAPSAIPYAVPLPPYGGARTDVMALLEARAELLCLRAELCHMRHLVELLRGHDAWAPMPSDSCSAVSNEPVPTDNIIQL